MFILGIDNSTNYISAAIMNDNHLICEYSVYCNEKSSRTLLPILSTLFDDIKLAISDIGLYCVTIGPGSFTSIRIGMAVAKTLAQVYSKPIVGISTLDIMAYAAGYQDARICPVVNLVKDEIYYAFFENKPENFCRTSEYFFGSIHDLANKVNKQTLLISNSTIEFETYINDILKPISKCIDYSKIFMGGKTVALRGLEIFKAGFQSTPYALVPLYIKNLHIMKKQQQNRL